ncbi:MAG: DNA mismatch repair endonuclease MutL [Myxococcaceae bacterium]
MPRIKVLSSALVNKIAAGEVVERPASVVKELAENSLDAEAKTIRVGLEGGGLKRIVITDDGFGMSKEDALLSLERHATSKLADEDGLFELVTKGFRGEAVPAIASVSRFVLTTSEPGAPSGVSLRLTGGAGLEVSDAAPLGGTQIEVDDLFFNTPARRKFMKRDQTELFHCEEAVARLALAHPEVSFFLEHEGRPLLSAPKATARERVAAILGSEAEPHLLEIEERKLGVTVSGFVASPELTLPNARRLYTFVNGRYIRDRGLISAVQRAFLDSLPPGRQPIAVVMIEIDPGRVDVNVHPQKLEVRFADPREVQEAVGAAVSRALKAAPWRKRNEDGTPVAEQAHYARAVERFLERAAISPLQLESQPQPAGLGERAPSFGEASPGINQAPPEKFFSHLRIIGELAKSLWVCEGQGGTLVVVDPKAALERVLRTRLTKAIDAPRGAPQASLFSQQVELDPVDAKRVAEKAPVFERIGFSLESFGGSTIKVTAVPNGYESVPLAPLLNELAPHLPAEPDYPARAFGPVLEVLAAWGAKQGPLEGHALLEALDAADFSLSCLHPKIVVLEAPLLDLIRSKN